MNFAMVCAKIKLYFSKLVKNTKKTCNSLLNFNIFVNFFYIVEF